VDPTTTWIGVSDEYVPLFTTEDGEMPVLHLAKPQIRKVGP
jgi:hypothetical protein